MSGAKPQNFRNHARFVPGYHFVLALIVVVTIVWSAWSLFRGFSAETVRGFLVAVALGLLFWYARIFALTVQDRVIRLEMRLRLHSLLPEEQRGRIDELTPGQLIGLRFAGDEELPALVGEVLEGKLRGRQEIKRRVRDWQPDHLRC